MPTEKGKWKVTSQTIDGEEKYAVVRVIDINKPEHSGNREYASGYMDDAYEADKLAVKLNELN